MKNLGKKNILFKRLMSKSPAANARTRFSSAESPHTLGAFILLFLMVLPAFAGVEVSVDKTQITRGETVTFTLRIKGTGKVRVPPLDQLCGFDIQGRGQRNQEVISNGVRQQELALMYTIEPAKSCVIESFPVSVNGEEFQTEALNITVSKMSISKDDPFIVKLSTDKTSVYVGEPFEMTVDFKKRQGIDTLAESISLPESKNLWVKSEYKGSTHTKQGFELHKSMYAMSAQQSGKLLLGPLRWDIKVRSRTRDYWGTFLASAKVRTVFSNEVDLDVKPLPDGIHLVGDMQIEVYVDKNEINAGEAVNVTIEVKGRANIEDIEAFDIHLNGAQAFMEEPKISHYLRDNRYYGSFIQKAALVAQRDFEVPSFELEYMDVQTDTIKRIHSNPVKVTVLNSAPLVKEELKISRPKITDEEEVEGVESGLSILQGTFLLLGGLVLGVIFSLFPWRKVLKRDTHKQKVSAKESKEVLQLLMGHMSEDKEVEALVKKLSENLYEGKNHKIDKKQLKEVVKRLQV